MLEFDVLQSGLVILLLLALGDVLTHFTRGAVPAVLFAGLAYMLCCWAGVLPGDLLESSGLGELPAAVMMMVIVNMGASMDISKFVSNWRVVLLAVPVFAGQLLALFAVVGGIYGVNTAVGGLPGGMAAALIVQERARALGYEQIITLSVLIMTTQALVGGPAATLCIKKESARLLASGETETEAVVVDMDPAQAKALCIAMNKLDGEWDNGSLADLLPELQDESADLLGTGFTRQEIDELLGDLGGAGDDDDPPTTDKKKDDKEGIKCIVGDYTFRLTEDEFADLMVDVREAVGFTQELICAELKRRLFDAV